MWRFGTLSFTWAEAGDTSDITSDVSGTWWFSSAESSACDMAPITESLQFGQVEKLGARACNPSHSGG